MKDHLITAGALILFLAIVAVIFIGLTPDVHAETCYQPLEGTYYVALNC